MFLVGIQLHKVERMVAVLLALGGLTICGCSEGQSPWERVHPASGTITYKGKPIKDAELAFFPVDPTAPETVRPKARTGPDGQFVVWTYSEGDGAPAGQYKVTVIRNEVTVSKDTIVAKPNDLPAKYSKRDSTDLQVSVIAGSNTLPKLELR